MPLPLAHKVCLWKRALCVRVYVWKRLSSAAGLSAGGWICGGFVCGDGMRLLLAGMASLPVCRIGALIGAFFIRMHSSRISLSPLYANG